MIMIDRLVVWCGVVWCADRRRVSSSSDGTVNEGEEMAATEYLQDLSKHDRDVVTSGSGEVGREELLREIPPRTSSPLGLTQSC